MDLGETEPAVCIERCVTATACGSEVSDVRAEEVLHTQENIRSALSLPAAMAADKVCYVCNIVLTVVQCCNMAAALGQCVVW
jgi:hypothetical protein